MASQYVLFLQKLASLNYKLPLTPLLKASTTVQNIARKFGIDLTPDTAAITGKLVQHQVLSANLKNIDFDNDSGFTFQWQANGQNIAKATQQTYKLTQADVGKLISLKVTYTDITGQKVTLVAKTGVPVINVNDAPTGLVVIQGQLQEDSVLTANTSGLADADGLGKFSYQWLANGVAITGANQANYVLKQADVGKAITVAVNYTDGFGAAEKVASKATAVVANLNDDPVGNVLIDGNAQENEVLTARADLSDADGVGSYSYQWFADGIAITGATARQYTLDQASVGKEITVKVSYVDRYGTTEGKASTATATVANVNDAATGTVSITGVAQEGEILTASAAVTDQDGVGTYTYKWYADGVEISGANGSQYTLDQINVGKEISVKVTYVDNYGATESLDSATTTAVTNINDAPTGIVTIDGAIQEGEELTANTGAIADRDGVGTYRYQWYVDDIAIGGATAEKYTLKQGDVGKAVTVKVSYLDAYGTEEDLNSNSTGAVANVNDTPSGAVMISGALQENATLTAGVDLTDTDGLGAYSFQWYADGVAIDGATGIDYVLSQANVGKNISVGVSYVDAYGAAESVYSSYTDAVSNVNNNPTGSVGIAGYLLESATVSADTSTLADNDGLGSYSYQWYADGVAIDSAVSANYSLSAADVGKALSVQITYIDLYGTTETVTSSVSSAVAPVTEVTLLQSATIDVIDPALNINDTQQSSYINSVVASTENDTVTVVDVLNGLQISLGNNGDNTDVDILDLSSLGQAASFNASGVLTSNAKTLTVTGVEKFIGSSYGDSLEGNSQNNTIQGGAGNDTIIGGDGNDTLAGGEGDDTLTGGNGNDVFAFGENAGNDSITDFDYYTDQLDFGSLTPVLEVADNNTTYRFDEENSVTLIGFNINDYVSS
ncbi:hypothetical protein [Legionella hackeliae]|uniref:Uncharacterized protein n=2 Tax=Legionella hackeliae TaxID=449 RepID=A0A0A8UNI9_LEGHA|nr:hypothetical protein [Legionella hackeliae]KTD08896.1 structural toxin protein RtxA [Legionella hackeliae]CEK10328.1 conserved protein of unknown function [Hemolysin-type calcium-binding region] [Legionella hackeliae]STX47057.1 structural toxin protein RtxA [Legionella hackeliae]